MSRRIVDERASRSGNSAGSASIAASRRPLGSEAAGTRRFEADTAANAQLASTVRLDSVKQEDYDTVFYPGGHGPMWDLVGDKNSIKLLESFLAAGKTFAVVCHSSGALRHI